MWNQLMDDEPLDDAEHYQQRKQQTRDRELREQEDMMGAEEQLCNGGIDDNQRRLSCESLNGNGLGIQLKKIK